MILASPSSRRPSSTGGSGGREAACRALAIPAVVYAAWRASVGDFLPVVAFAVGFVAQSIAEPTR